MTGRFAPSPTGPLHLGSLLAATASYLDARATAQPWLLRIDDLDIHRNVPGATDVIKAALDAHDLHWDGQPIHQSERVEHYRQALESLQGLGLVYYCSCSRRQLKGSAVYPGTCRKQTTAREDCAVRILVGDRVVEFEDRIQGQQREALANSRGDFVVRRRDGLIAYQLATAMDDGSSEIDSVVRGADLLDNTPWQIYLMQVLGLTPPAYAHVPTLTHPDGSKLSKQTFATPVSTLNASANMTRALHWLGLTPPADAGRWPCAELLAWGVGHWAIDRVPKLSAIAVS